MDESMKRTPFCLVPSTLFAWLIVTLSPQPLQAQGPPPAPVIVDEVKQEQVQERRSVTGEVRARRSSRIATREPGLVTSLPVREGERVEKGDLLVKLDSKRLDIQLAEARADADLVAAVRDEQQAEVDRTSRDLAALEKLRERGATNPKELIDAETAALAAQARLRQAKQRIQVSSKKIELLEQRVKDMSIVAPFSGTVVERHVGLGEWVGEGTSVLALLSTDDVEVWLWVSQRYLAAVRKPGIEINIQIEALQQELRSSDFRIVPQMQSGSRQFALIAQVEQTGRVLAPGMSVTGHVPAGAQSEHLTIHRDSILRGETGPYVYAVRDTGDGQPRAMLVPLQVLFSNRERVVVKAPLQPGETVVIEGNERLFPMAPVIPKPAAGASQPGAKPQKAQSPRAGS